MRREEDSRKMSAVTERAVWIMSPDSTVLDLDGKQLWYATHDGSGSCTPSGTVTSIEYAPEPHVSWAASMKPVCLEFTLPQWSEELIGLFYGPAAEDPHA